MLLRAQHCHVAGMGDCEQLIACVLCLETPVSLRVGMISCRVPVQNVITISKGEPERNMRAKHSVSSHAVKQDHVTDVTSAPGIPW